MNKFIAASFLFLLGIAFTGCSTNENEAHYIQLSFENIEPLEEGYYQLWTANSVKKTSIKKFNLKDGQMIDIENNRKLNRIKVDHDLYDESLVQITIGHKDNEVARESVFLSGAIEGKKAEMGFYSVNLHTVEGKYVIASYSDKDFPNEKSGIWFVDLENNEPVRGLDMSPTPWGWVYEGWVEYEGKVFSTGRFSQRSGKDTGGRYSTTLKIPDFPGEDFLKNAPEGTEFPLNLTEGGWRVFITLEPDLGNFDPTGNDPFNITLLSSEIPKDTQVHTVQEMEVDMKVMPSAVAEIW